ncbi:MAG: hypothetical protein HZB92_03345 [Euryarchaeota archaeon]|nr:hypothetical protein [Euryarchaeota archaeon]
MYRKIAGVCVLFALLAAGLGISGRTTGCGVQSATMEVNLDTANSRLTITIVSDTAWDTSMNFTIAPKRVILEPVEGTLTYHAAIESKVVAIDKLEVYKVIPNHEPGADGVFARFNTGQGGIQATFLDAYTARLGPFDVDLGNMTGGTIPLDIDPIFIDPW